MIIHADVGGNFKSKTMRYILIILGFTILIQTHAQEKGNFDDNISYKRIVKVGDKYLIKTLKYYYQERRYISAFYEYPDSVSREFKIRDNSEILNIQENATEYYCLLRNSSSIELLKTYKNNFKWVSLYKINDNEEEYDLIISNDKILILSNTKIYHNLKTKAIIKPYDLSKLTCEKRIFSINSVCYYSDNVLFIGNNYGEWGGNLLRLKYDITKDNFTCENLLEDNVIKIVPNRDCIYILSLVQHLGGLSNTLYKISNDKINIIFSQGGYGKKISCKNDVFNWEKIISGMPILNIESYGNSLLLLVHKKGIYNLLENNNLDLIKQLNINKTYSFNNGSAPYIAIDEAENLQVLDNYIYVIHNLPFVTKIKLK